MCKCNLYLFNWCRNQLELWHLLFAVNVKTHIRDTHSGRPFHLNLYFNENHNGNGR